MQAYHDLEWGVPLHDDRALFELLTLEGAQAGLSWMTILRRRDSYRRAFADFEPARVAIFGDDELQRLLADPGVVRNRAKLVSTINNARRVLDIQQELGSFDSLVWSFVEGTPLVNEFQAMGELPAQTPASLGMSRELRTRGFRFVGPTICYAFMQAAGLVNDHLVGCFRHEPCARLQASFKLPGTGTGPGSAARGAGGTARTARTPKASSRA
jgi:DNA-3-methyladenine glycosylase I